MIKIINYHKKLSLTAWKLSLINGRKQLNKILFLALLHVQDLGESIELIFQYYAIGDLYLIT